MTSVIKIKIKIPGDPSPSLMWGKSTHVTTAAAPLVVALSTTAVVIIVTVVAALTTLYGIMEKQSLIV